MSESPEEIYWKSRAEKAEANAVEGFELATKHADRADKAEAQLQEIARLFDIEEFSELYDLIAAIKLKGRDDEGENCGTNICAM